MLRRCFAVLTLAVILGPSLAVAQATPDASPDAWTIFDAVPTPDEIGPGWILLHEEHRPNPNTGLDRRTVAYGGPSGARLLISLYPLSDRLSERSEQWRKLSETWQAWANFFNEPFTDASKRLDVPRTLFKGRPLPEGVNDAIRYGAVDPTWPSVEAAASLYALENGPGVLIVVSGEINDATMVDATDALVELVISKVDHR